MEKLWHLGYSAEDLISNIFRVCKNLDIAEWLKLKFVRVCIKILWAVFYAYFLNNFIMLFVGNWINSFKHCGWTEQFVAVKQSHRTTLSINC